MYTYGGTCAVVVMNRLVSSTNAYEYCHVAISIEPQVAIVVVELAL